MRSIYFEFLISTLLFLEQLHSCEPKSNSRSKTPCVRVFGDSIQHFRLGFWLSLPRVELLSLWVNGFLLLSATHGTRERPYLRGLAPFHRWGLVVGQAAHFAQEVAAIPCSLSLPVTDQRDTGLHLKLTSYVLACFALTQKVTDGNV